jgi:hypothetical protein
MTVINEPTSNKINKNVGYSNMLIIQKIITEEKNMSFREHYKELDDEDSFCFVLGYN